MKLELDFSKNHKSIYKKFQNPYLQKQFQLLHTGSVEGIPQVPPTGQKYGS